LRQNNKMNLIIRSKTNQEKGTTELPVQFQESIREDLIRRAVLAEQSAQRQPYGANPRAGKRASAELSRRRKKYRGSYGQGISRVPRKILSRRGTRMMWVGAVAPGMVGGRRAHPPKAEKIWEQKMNKKEWKKALRSALAGTLQILLVQSRGHTPPKDYPFILETACESIEKTQEVKQLFHTLGVTPELERAKHKTVRAGKGKMRGRKYRKKKGPLIVVADTCPLAKAGRNIPGVDVIILSELQVSHLAPGTHVGRLTFFTQHAIEKVGKESLFI